MSSVHLGGVSEVSPKENFREHEKLQQAQQQKLLKTQNRSRKHRNQKRNISGKASEFNRKAFEPKHNYFRT